MRSLTVINPSESLSNLRKTTLMFACRWLLNTDILRLSPKPYSYCECYIALSTSSALSEFLFARAEDGWSYSQNEFSHLTRCTLLTSYSIVKPTKDDLVRLIYMQVFKRRLITWIRRWAKYCFWPFIITSLLFSSL